jgi:hypothetical protein
MVQRISVLEKREAENQKRKIAAEINPPAGDGGSRITKHETPS